jgi:hypothetical protein
VFGADAVRPEVNIERPIIGWVLFGQRRNPAAIAGQYRFRIVEFGEMGRRIPQGYRDPGRRLENLETKQRITA